MSCLGEETAQIDEIDGLLGRTRYRFAHARERLVSAVGREEQNAKRLQRRRMIGSNAQSGPVSTLSFGERSGAVLFPR